MRIKLRKQVWNGVAYNQATPYLASWSFTDIIDTWDSLRDWCIKQFGPEGSPCGVYPERWYLNGGRFFFKEDSDLTLFLLRWS